jgi:hypothetical protein
MSAMTACRAPGQRVEHARIEHCEFYGLSSWNREARFWRLPGAVLNVDAPPSRLRDE